MRRTYGKDPLYGLLLTFGAAMVIEEAIRRRGAPGIMCCPCPRRFSGAFVFQGLIWSTYRFYAAGIAIVAIGLVWLAIERTRTAPSSRRARMTAKLVARAGINLSRFRLAVFVLGTMLAALAGIILAPVWGIRRTWGSTQSFRVPHHRARRRGQLLGSVLSPRCSWPWRIGITAPYASEWSLLSIYILLVLVVTVRARGLFGKRSLLEA
jgi:branched-chain amino acid transport system permease protein